MAKFIPPSDSRIKWPMIIFNNQLKVNQRKSLSWILLAHFQVPLLNSSCPSAIVEWPKNWNNHLLACKLFKFWTSKGVKHYILAWVWLEELNSQKNEMPPTSLWLSSRTKHPKGKRELILQLQFKFVPCFTSLLIFVLCVDLRWWF